MGAFVSFDQGRIHNSSLDTSISYIVHCVYIYIYIRIHVHTCAYPCLCVSACANVVCPARRPRRRSKRCTNFAGYGYAEIKKRQKVDEGEEKEKKGKGRTGEGSREKEREREKSVYLNLNFEFYRWHMVPGDATIRVPWSAIGCSFRSRRPSIFEEDRPKVSRGTPSTPRPFSNVCVCIRVCIYIFIHVYVSEKRQLHPRCKFQITP